MKYSLAVITAAGLLLYPFAAFATDYGSQTVQTQQPLPVAQTLIREGDFAIKLAAQFNLGSFTDEAIAEDSLAKVGIVPLNGWLSDYPVTPEIVGQLQAAVAQAATEGRLSMTTNDATGSLYALSVSLGLPAPTSPEGTVAEIPQPVSPYAVQNPSIVNNYYLEQGPPIVTYYPPPYDYLYLYDWVPYPAYWYGYWFSGFYICRDFTTTVIVSNRPHRPFPYDRDHDGDNDRDDHGRHRVITNRVIDPVTRNVAIVTPSYRTGSGIVKPVTTLRTRNGGMFTNIAELGRAGRMPVRSEDTRGTIMNSNRAGKNDRFRSDDARNSAASIYSQSVARTSSGVFRSTEAVRTINGSESRPAASQRIERSYQPANQPQLMNSNGYRSTTAATSGSNRSIKGKTGNTSDEDKGSRSQSWSDTSSNAQLHSNDWRSSTLNAPNHQGNVAHIMNRGSGVAGPSSRSGQQRTSGNDRREDTGNSTMSSGRK